MIAAVQKLSGDSMQLVGALIGMAGGLVLCWQCIQWLQDGIWIALPLVHFWGVGPIFEWRGVDIIAHDLLQLPLAPVMMVLGVAIRVAGILMTGAGIAKTLPKDRPYWGFLRPPGV